MLKFVSRDAKIYDYLNKRLNDANLEAKVT
jgi:hypothetical protein